MAKIPVYEMFLDNDLESDIGVNIISLVETPAIGQTFIKFSKTKQPVKYSISSEDRRIVTGPILIPNLPIYRNDENGEYYIYVNKDTILSIVERFFKKSQTSSVNLEHSGDNIEGVFMFESLISDENRGIFPPEAFKELPEGTWFGSYKVENDEIWAKIKDGTFQGFSIEGFFNFEELTKVEQKSNPKPKSNLQILNELKDLFM